MSDAGSPPVPGAPGSGSPPSSDPPSGAWPSPTGTGTDAGPASLPAGAPAGTGAGRPLRVERTRTSAAYVGIAVGLLVLVLVIIFIVQNLHGASVHFITLRFRLPVGIVVLGSVVAGGAIVLLVSLARVAQLRLLARRHRSQHESR